MSMGQLGALYADVILAGGQAKTKGDDIDPIRQQQHRWAKCIASTSASPMAVDDRGRSRLRGTNASIFSASKMRALQL